MSASEKLKELDAALTPGTWGWDERVVNAHNSVYYLTGTASDIADDVASIAALRNALPQIVAVVEAAEKAVKDEQYGIRRTPIPAALAALEEALR